MPKLPESYMMSLKKIAVQGLENVKDGKKATSVMMDLFKDMRSGRKKQVDPAKLKNSDGSPKSIEEILSIYKNGIPGRKLEKHVKTRDYLDAMIEGRERELMLWTELESLTKVLGEITVKVEELFDAG